MNTKYETEDIKGPFKKYHHDAPFSDQLLVYILKIDSLIFIEKLTSNYVTCALKKLNFYIDYV